MSDFDNKFVNGKSLTRLANKTKEYIDNAVSSIDTDNLVITNSISIGRKADTEIGTKSLAVGINTEASGNFSHAEGNSTTASGNSSHTEGAMTTASASCSHAEGNGTTASASCSHAEGTNTKASGYYSHTEGSNTKASGYASHAEGHYSEASGDYSHAEGFATTASGEYSHAEGARTIASSEYQHVQGRFNIEDSTNTYAHIVGNGEDIETDEGEQVIYSNAHTLDWNGNAWFAGDVSVGANNKVLATKEYVDNTINTNDLVITNSISMGRKAGTTVGEKSVAVGYDVTASGDYSHAEGSNTNASGYCSHAEGATTASGDCSHAEGLHSEASADYSHAEGFATKASGPRSHAEGYYTIAAGNSQHVQGKHNIEDTTNTYAHIVGNGTSGSARSNAHTLDWNGNAWFAGDVYVGGTSQDTDSKKLATEEYVDESVNGLFDNVALNETETTDTHTVLDFYSNGEVVKTIRFSCGLSVMWVYKDTDVSKLKTDEAITKVYIELTNSNFTSRIDEVLQYYPNCTNVCFFEDGSVTSLRSMLNGYNTNYKSQITNVTFLDGYFNNVTTMYATFRDCKSLTTVSNIPGSVTIMKQTFYGCTSLIIPPDIPNSVTDMNSTFYNCTSLTTAPNIGSNVTDMESTFYGCTSLITVPNLPNSVTYMYYTFRGCSSLTTVPDIPNGVTIMVGTFDGCTSLITAPKILSTSITSINSLYYGCTKLQSCEVPIYASNYSNALRDVPSTCNITWLGERTTDFDVYNTLYYRNANQADIRELVVEHLANLASSGKSAILTLGSTSLAYLTSAQKTQATNKGWVLQ